MICKSTKKIVARAIVFCAVILFAGLVKTHAAINIEVDREFSLSLTGEMQVSEQEKITNNFSNQYIPGGAPRKYFFVISSEDRQKVAEQIYSTLSLKLNGETIDYTRVTEGDSFGIEYQFRRRLNPGTSQTVSISYVHPELGERIGGVLDAYIPAFAEDFQFELGSTAYKYRTRLKVPNNVDENIVSVAPISKYSEGNFDTYVFDQESLKGKFVWVQRGSQQVYKFTMSQFLEATQSRNTGNLNEYRLVIPRDISEVNVSQKIYYTKMDPEPIRIETDEEGNLLGVYQVAAHKDVTIEISGYAVLRNQERQDLANSGTLEDINSAQIDLSRYTKEAEYWEVNAAAITEKAKSVVGESEQVSEIVSGLYRNVVDSIDYSQVKRFGINERQGALKTLQSENPAAVCMEYSDLYLTLLRNRGIPTRAAFGYGYDSRLGADGQEPHQWVQVYLPEYENWISVDVTWGESGPEIIGGDLNHFYTHVAAQDPNTPSVLSRLSLESSATDIQPPEFKVDVLARLPEGLESDSLTHDQLLDKYQATETDDKSYLVSVLKNKLVTSWRNLFTNPGDIDIQGWGLIVFTGFIGLFIILVIINIVSRIAKAIRKWLRKKRRKAPETGVRD